MTAHAAAQAFWVGLVVSALSAYPLYRALLRWKSRQTVSRYAPESHQSKQGTPTMGGLIVLVGLVVALGLVPESGRAAWLVVLIGFATIGFADDYVVPRLMPGKRGLGWRQKLAGQTAVAAGGLVLIGPGDAIALGIGLVLVLFFSNAYNFADGLDALAGSLAVLLSFGFGALAWTAGSPLVWAASAAIVGAFGPFLFLNAPPARLFMGDVGALSIGALFGLMTFELGRTVPEPWMLSALGLLGMVMAAELIPVPLQVLSVKLWKRRLFPYTPIHHAFEKAGWPETRVVWAFGLVQAVLAAGAATIAFLAGGRS
jgi:phospho-N-acetylmuramoyl-pentapeptide-transferase